LYLLKIGCKSNWNLRKNQKNFIEDIENAIKLQGSQISNLKLISQIDLMHFDFKKDLLDCDIGSFWSDVDHLSISGEKKFFRRLPDTLF